MPLLDAATNAVAASATPATATRGLSQPRWRLLVSSVWVDERGINCKIGIGFSFFGFESKNEMFEIIVAKLQKAQKLKKFLANFLQPLFVFYTKKAKNHKRLHPPPPQIF